MQIISCNKIFEIMFLWFEEQSEKFKPKDRIILSRVDEQWIKEINDEYLPIAIKNGQEFFRKESQRPSQILGKKRYEKSEKGKRARKRVHALRRHRIKNCIISEEEKELIRRFYEECPSGYSVDHIVPLSKGGAHELSNLQWMLYSMNSRKNAKIIPQLSEFPHCRLDLESIL